MLEQSYDYKNILDIQQLSYEKICTGCGSCFNVCPHHAIDMKRDDEGFLYPTVDSCKCESCRLCVKVCPLFSKNENTEPVCYAVCAEDELRFKSSSGGAFSVIALEVLQRGGLVSGAEYDCNLNVRHTLISSVTELDALRKSKYLQSDTGTVYRQIKDALQNRIPVLFTGCPCQTAGLKFFLGEKYPNLILVDILCHGVASPPVFSRYIEEKFGHKSICDYQFRLDGSECNWGDFLSKAVLNTGEIQYIPAGDNMYLQGYLNNLFLRPSCYNCKFAEPPHQSDITIGDFWGIQDFDVSLNDGKGTSALIINTEHGAAFFSSIRSKFRQCMEVPMDFILRNRMNSRIDVHPLRNKFMALIKNMPFSRAIHYTLGSGFDVGIVGIYAMQNFGSQLTYYSLYRYIRELGYQVSMIERPDDSIWKTNGNPSAFAQDPYDEGSRLPLFSNKHEMNRLNEMGEVFILGSDIMWNYDMYHLIGNISYFDYIRSDKTKISYATSFGKPTDCPEKEYSKLKFYINRFDAISVREDVGVTVCRDRFGTEAMHTMDPVFIVDKKHLDALANRSTKTENQEFILFYLLDLTEDFNVIKDYAELLGMKAVVVTDAEYYLNNARKRVDYVEPNVSVEDILYYFKHASAVVTDSYHGICFSLIYQKRFIAVENQQRGTQRMSSLLNMLDLSNLIISNLSDLSISDPKLGYIDYDRVVPKLRHKIVNSQQWLKNAISIKKPSGYTQYDIVKEMIESYSERFNSLEKKITEIDQWMKLVGDTFAAIHDRFESLSALSTRTEEKLIEINTTIISNKRFEELMESSTSAVQQQFLTLKDEVVRLKSQIDRNN